ncbi:MAG TPA: hypothetical protein PLU43_10735, partial [Lachnospiraceae bacterium]|nr:hypothetical protein [Lachnospiraceae bacterium]
MKTKKEAANQIQKNYRISESLKKIIRIERREPDRLELIKYLIHFDINHFTGRYSDEWIERELAEYGKKIEFYHKLQPEAGKILHVMTKAYQMGGHTPIVSNWIDYDDTKSYAVVFTQMKPVDIPCFFRETAEKNGAKLLFLRGRDDMEKAKELLKISDRYEKIVLHIHMYDIVPILAYSNENWKRPVYFYNHANFLFSLGISVSDCVLCICRYDKIKAIRYRGAKNACVLPLPLKTVKNHEVILQEKGADRAKFREEICQIYAIPADGRIILSMGADFKYEKIIDYDFAAFAAHLLQETENTYFFIIGADPSK